MDDEMAEMNTFLNKFDEDFIMAVPCLQHSDVSLDKLKWTTPSSHIISVLKNGEDVDSCW